MNRLPKHVRIINFQSGFSAERNISLKLVGLSENQKRNLLSVFPHKLGMISEKDGNLILMMDADSTKSFLQDLSSFDDLFGLKNELEHTIRICQNPYDHQWKFGGRQFDFSSRTAIMGVLNITPDSFSDGGKFFDRKLAIEHGLRMTDAGADIIDIGGESTRPGAIAVTEQEEIDRVIPVIEVLRQQRDIPISIDTYKSNVAKEAINAGAEIVNDISGAMFDPGILHVVKKYQTGLILMHIKGTPRNMQQNPVYDDVIEEILTYLDRCVNQALEAGISPNQVLIDPGIGFGKRWFDNYDIINHLQEFHIFDLPILIGVSRKSFLGKFLSKYPADRLAGSLAATVLAIRNGSHVIRTHDINETKEAVKIADLFYRRLLGMDVEVLEELFHG